MLGFFRAVLECIASITTWTGLQQMFSELLVGLLWAESQRRHPSETWDLSEADEIQDLTGQLIDKDIKVSELQEEINFQEDCLPEYPTNTKALLEQEHLIKADITKEDQLFQITCSGAEAAYKENTQKHTEEPEGVAVYDEPKPEELLVELVFHPEQGHKKRTPNEELMHIMTEQTQENICFHPKKKDKIKENEWIIEELREEIHLLQEQESRKNKEIEENERIIKGLKEKICFLQEQESRRNAHPEAQQQMLEELQEEIRFLREQLPRKNAQLEEHEQRMKQLQKEICYVREKHHRKDIQFVENERIIQEQREEIRFLREQEPIKNAQIEKCEGIIEELQKEIKFLIEQDVRKDALNEENEWVIEDLQEEIRFLREQDPRKDAQIEDNLRIIAEQREEIAILHEQEYQKDTSLREKERIIRNYKRKNSSSKRRYRRNRRKTQSMNLSNPDQDESTHY